MSRELPAARFTLDKSYRYVGGQVVNLYGVASAEQHLFVKGDHRGAVDSFYWVQFEHYLPNNQHTYQSLADREMNFGLLRFTYDVKAFSDYDGMQAKEDPRSDSAALRKLLAEHDLGFPKRAARVRAFHLPSPDHRSELMIIYGEALPSDSPIPASQDGVALDANAGDTARLLVEHAQRGLTIQPLK